MRVLDCNGSGSTSGVIAGVDWVTRMLLQGAIFAWAYPRLVEHPEQLGSGLKFATAAALLSWSFTTLAVAAKHPMTSISGFVAIETGFTVIQFLLVGPLLPLASRARTGEEARVPG